MVIIPLTMDKEIGKCGYCCSDCPAFKTNLRSDADRIAASRAWHLFLGRQVAPELLRCDGCQQKGHGSTIVDEHCPVRVCATSKGFETCAECNHYLCHDLRIKAEVYEDILLRFNAMILPEEYAMYVRPYEGKLHLDAIRDHQQKILSTGSITT